VKQEVSKLLPKEEANLIYYSYIRHIEA